MPRVAAIYVRISEDREGAGLGVARQEEDCRKLCALKGWEVAETYTDNDIGAYSGKPRPAYNRMLEDLKHGRRDAMVVWHIDRLTRQPRELEDLIDLHESAKFSMATVTGDVDLGKDDGKMMARIMGAVARGESDAKKRRIRRKNEERAQQGEWLGGGTRPFGFKEDRVTHDLEEAALIREAASRVLARESLWAVAKDWEKRDVRTVTGTRWRTTILKEVLTRPRVAGLRQHRGEVVVDEHGQPVPATWQPIITQAEREQLRGILFDPARLKFSGHQQANKYPLTGLVYCELCQEKLIARPNGRKVRCYVCASGPDNDGCGKMRVVAAPLEEYVGRQVYLAEEIYEVPTTTTVGAADAEAQQLLAAVRKDEATLAEVAHRRFVEETMADVEYVPTRIALVKRVEQTKKRLAELHVSAAQPTWKKFIDQAVTVEEARADPRQLEAFRRWVSRAVEKVVVHPAVRGRNFFTSDRVEIVWRKAPEPEDVSVIK